MATGYTNSRPRDEGDFYFETRFSWSSSYDPSTNRSTVTFSPQIYTTVNMGNDLRMFNSKDNNGGIYRDGSLIYAFPTNYSSGNYLKTYSNPFEDWCGLFAAGDDFPTLTVAHDSNGDASIKFGLRGGVLSMNSGQSAYSSWIDDGYSVSIHENRSLNVSYNANGGSGAPSATYFYGSTESITLSSTQPTRAGYTFLGWATSSSATSATYSPGQNIGTRTSSLVLYAVWRINSHTVSLSAGDNVSSVSGGGSKNYGASVTVSATLSSATGYTYSFTGWYNGSTRVSTANPYTFTMGDADVSLTAVGARTANTYTVAFNANGGSGTMANESFTYDVPKALTANAFTRTGYDFLGWSRSSTATAATYTDGQTVSNLAASGTITLYAVWRLKTYTVSYDANGGTGAPSSQTKTYGVDLTLSTTQPTRADSAGGNYVVYFNAAGGSGAPARMSSQITIKYAFSAWRASSSSSTYSPGSAYRENASCTMVAQWSTTRVAETITLPTPTREGYTFRGWSEDPNASSGITGSYTPSTTVTLYAIWQLKTYKLYISQGAGSTVLVTRNGTVLNSGATISHFDLLTISITANEGYSITTGTVNGITWTSGDLTVSGQVNVQAVAAKKTYRLQLTRSDLGTVVNVLRTSSPIGGAPSGLLNNNAVLYYGDTLSVTCTINGGYTLEQATVDGVDIPFNSQGVGQKNLTVGANVVVVVTVKLGAIVYIGGEAYQAFIYDGSSWNQYEAFIGNGTSFDPY